MEKDVEKRSGHSRAQFGLVVCAVLIVILAVSNVWFYSELKDQIDLRARAYDGIVVGSQFMASEDVETPFFFYYVKPEEQKFGVNSLSNELEGLKWSREYELGLFDCTEMSAYLERYLENQGWHAQIVVGDSPFGPGRHAWLLVETSEGGYMPVESTTIQIVWWSAPSYGNYWVYDYRFETIVEALSYSDTAFDWWTVYPQ